MKIRTRLTLQFAVIVASILLLFSFAIYYFSSQYRQQEIYKRLKDRAITTDQLFVEKKVDDRTQKLVDSLTRSSLEDERIVIYDTLNHIAYNIPDNKFIHVTIPILNKIRTEKEISYRNGKNEIFGMIFNYNSQPYIVMSSTYDKYGEAKLTYLKWLLATLFVVSMGIILIAGWLFSQQGLRPISNVVKQVDKITVSNLNEKVNEGNGTDEIAQLAITFNNMLSRIKSSFELQKNFVANASHELRTPLTVLTGQIGVALMQERTGAEYQELLHSLLDDIRNMNKLTNHLLELAFVSRDVSEFKLQPERIDELLLAARSELIKRHPDFTISIKFEDLPENENKMTIPANEQLLKTAFINIMDNGCKFSANKQISVLFSQYEEGFKITFKDEGIGISEGEIKQIFEPLYRSPNARQFSGHGLGLALTQRIIQVHKGTINICSQLNQGTTIEVLLPSVA